MFEGSWGRYLGGVWRWMGVVAMGDGDENEKSEIENM